MSETRGRAKRLIDPATPRKSSRAGGTPASVGRLSDGRPLERTLPPIPKRPAPASLLFSRVNADRVPVRRFPTCGGRVRHRSEPVDVDHGQLVYPSLGGLPGRRVPARVRPRRWAGREQVKVEAARAVRRGVSGADFTRAKACCAVAKHPSVSRRAQSRTPSNARHPSNACGSVVGRPILFANRRRCAVASYAYEICVPQ